MSQQPVVSVLFGTFNRMALLQRCVDSVREAVGELTYEIVICDAGSSDGSRQWLSEQPDVVLVGRQELTGAVVAFNHCQQLARGKYLCTLNDDVEVEDGAIASAVEMLEQEPSVGQIAFGLRRLGAGPWLVNYISPPAHYYANFGVVRADLVDRIATITGGMWSPCYYTYGADVELSCWVYRLGYQVKPCKELHVNDHEHRDGLRVANHDGGKAERDGKLYNQRWGNHKASLQPGGPIPNVTPREKAALREVEAGRDPDPPPIAPLRGDQTLAPSAPASANDYVTVKIGEERSMLEVMTPEEGHAPWRLHQLPSGERVVHLHLDSPAEPQTTMVEAIRSLSRDGGEHRLVCWPALHNRGGMAAVEGALNQACQQIRPTLVFLQLQRGDVVSPEAVAALRAHCDEKCVIVSWTGDVVNQFGDTNHWFYPLAQQCDVMAFSCLSHVKLHRKQGMPRTAYLQIGYDEDRYFPGPPNGYGRQWDVVYLAQRYRPEHLVSIAVGNDADLRVSCGEALMRYFGKRGGVFGGGWPRGSVEAAASADVYRGSKLAVSISMSSQLERYSSDRLLRALACGCGVLCKDFIDSASWGLKDGANVFMFDTVEQCLALARKWTAADRQAEVRAVGAAGAELARAHHTWAVRMAELGVYMAAVRGQRVEIDRPW